MDGCTVGHLQESPGMGWQSMHHGTLIKAYLHGLERACKASALPRNKAYAGSWGAEKIFQLFLKVEVKVLKIQETEAQQHP